MNDNEKLIEEAAKAMADGEHNVLGWRGHSEDEQEWYRKDAAIALAVFEKSHTPTDDQLAKQITALHWGVIRDDALSGDIADAGRASAALLRRSEVPGPSAAREFLKAALAESDADEAEGGAGWDVEVDARTVLGLLDETCEPQVEPSDAQVLAALNAYYAPDGYPGKALSHWSEGSVRAMRAALKAAAGGVR